MENYRVKISGLILNDKKELLLFRNTGKTIWTCPGGKVEGEETDLECLKRELKEEAMINLLDAEFLIETPVEPAAGSPGAFIKMRFYIVKKFEGEIKNNPDDNVEELMWISKDEFLKNLENKTQGNSFMEIGSGLEQYAIPKLIETNLMGS